MKKLLVLALFSSLAFLYSCQKDAFNVVNDTPQSLISVDERGGGRGHHHGDSTHVDDSTHIHWDTTHVHPPHDTLGHDSIHIHHGHIPDSTHVHVPDSTHVHPPQDTTGHPGGGHPGGHHGGHHG